MGCGKGTPVAIIGWATLIGCAQKVTVDNTPAERPPPSMVGTTHAESLPSTALWDVFHEALTSDPGHPELHRRAPGQILGRFKITFYWVETPKDATGPRVAVYDRSCEVIARVPARFARRMRLQGTARLEDGRLINIAGRCSCPRSPCFFVADDYVWGVGVKMRPLTPFRSVAVDRDVIAIGDTLYIPALDGVRVPGELPWGGYVHDGCVIADDVGGGIDGRHLDFFTGGRWGYAGLPAIREKRAITVFAGGDLCP